MRDCSAGIAGAAETIEVDPDGAGVDEITEVLPEVIGERADDGAGDPAGEIAPGSAVAIGVGEFCCAICCDAADGCANVRYAAPPISNSKNRSMRFTVFSKPRRAQRFPEHRRPIRANYSKPTAKVFLRPARQSVAARTEIDTDSSRWE